MEALVAITSLATYAVLVAAIPPAPCFANFRWDDCGKTPQSVIYYWKPGSRCEVGTWRGCLPNPNMFRDEYECVSTCIFSVRGGPSDFHKHKDYEESGEFSDYASTTDGYDDNITSTTDVSTTTDSVDGDTGTTDADSGGSDNNPPDNDEPGDEEPAPDGEGEQENPEGEGEEEGEAEEPEEPE